MLQFAARVHRAWGCVLGYKNRGFGEHFGTTAITKNCLTDSSDTVRLSVVGVGKRPRKGSHAPETIRGNKLQGD